MTPSSGRHGRRSCCATRRASRSATASRPRSLTSKLPDAADREFAALQLSDQDLAARPHGAAVAKQLDADQKCVELRASSSRRRRRRAGAALLECLDKLKVPAGCGGGPSSGSRPRRTGAMRPRRRWSTPPARAARCTAASTCSAAHDLLRERSREKINGLKEGGGAGQREDEKSAERNHRRAQVEEADALPFCETPAIHTNACDHMQCAKTARSTSAAAAPQQGLLDLGARGPLPRQGGAAARPAQRQRRRRRTAPELEDSKPEPVVLNPEGSGSRCRRGGGLIAAANNYGTAPTSTERAE